MTNLQQKIQDTIANPFLSNARAWFMSGSSGLYTVIGSRASMITGETESWRVTKLSKADAHFVVSGMEILDRLNAEDRSPEVVEMAREIFENSSACQGWELLKTTIGVTQIVASNGSVISVSPVSATKDEIAYLNDLPKMVRYLLDK